MVTALHSSKVQWPAERPARDDNIADLPSRGEWRLLLTLGGSGSFRAAVVPPVSSFVGPLLPLLGRRVAPV